MGLLTAISALPAHVVSAAGNLLGSGVSLLGQSLLNRQGLAQSKEMYDYQLDYRKRMDAMIAAGISPAAASQGLSGAQPSAVGMSGGSAPDLSNLGTQAIQSKLANEQANYTKVDASWLGTRYNALVNKTFSEIRLNDRYSEYYHTLDVQTRLLTPFKVAEAAQNLRNLATTYDILKAQHTQLNLQNWKLNWENGLRRAGYNPDEDVFKNLYRLSVTDPEKFEEVFNNIVTAIDKISSVVIGTSQDTFSDHFDEIFDNEFSLLKALHKGFPIFGLPQNIYDLLKK